MLHSILCVRAFTPPPKGIPRDNTCSQEQDTDNNIVHNTFSEADKPKELVQEVYDGSNPPCLPEKPEGRGSASEKASTLQALCKMKVSQMH